MSSPDSALEQLLQRLLAQAKPRADRDQPGLASPSSPSPLLVQGPESFVALALGLELLHGLAPRGGTALSPQRIQALRDEVRARFSSVEGAHLDEEALRIWMWIDDALHAQPEDENDELFDPASTQGLIEEAIAREQDLYMAVLGDDDRHFTRRRIQPEALGGDPVVLIGLRVSDGLPFEIELRRIRWVMPVQRVREVTALQMADVLTFKKRS